MNDHYQFAFDATQFAPEMGAAVLPAGTYDVIIQSAELKPSKNGEATNLVLRYGVMSGQFQGSPLFQYLSIFNNNATAVEIAQKTLSAICHVTGRYQLGPHNGGINALVGAYLKVQVSVEKTERGENNRITQVFDTAGNIPKRANMVAGNAPPPPPNYAPAAPQAPAMPAAAPAPAMPQGYPAPAMPQAPQAAPQAAPNPFGAPPAMPPQAAPAPAAAPNPFGAPPAAGPSFAAPMQPAWPPRQ